MRIVTRRSGLAMASALVMLPLAASSVPAQATPQPRQAPGAPTAAQPDCSRAQTVKRKLSNGTTWKLCWRNNSTAGLVVEHVSYHPKHETKPIKVLRSGKLGQIHVPYDDGNVEYNDVTEMEFGNGVLPLKAKDCPGGTIRSITVPNWEDDGLRKVNGLCVTTQPRGFAYHGDSSDVGERRSRIDSAQGQDLVLYTINQVGYYHYITQWNFSDDGTITPKVGATGNLSPGDFDAADGKGWPLGKGSKDRATSHSHNVFWRLNFHPDGSNKAKVEQYDTKRTGTGRGTGVPIRTTSRTKVTKEFAGRTSPSRWWRVVSPAKNSDGHPRSWEIVHQNSDRYPHKGFTKNDIYFTQYRKCEQYPNQNRQVMGACRNTVVDFVNGEQLKNPVAWVNVGFHHIARDEDQTPMPAHWQGFQIVPRDVTAMNPLTPKRLHNDKHNGKPHDMR